MRRFAAVLLAMSAATAASGGVAIGVAVPGPPPAVRVERRGGAHRPACVWVGGYWAWSSRWVWAPGAWVAPPHARAAWVPARWYRHGGGWRWAPGYWR